MRSAARPAVSILHESLQLLFTDNRFYVGMAEKDLNSVPVEIAKGDLFICVRVCSGDRK